MITEMMKRLFDDHVLVELKTGVYCWNGNWECTLSKAEGGTSIRVVGTSDSDYEEAVKQAYARYYRIIDYGAPEMSSPMIEHRPDSEIPSDNVPF